MMIGVRGEKYHVEMFLGHVIRNFGSLFKKLVLKGIILGFSKGHGIESFRNILWIILEIWLHI